MSRWGKTSIQLYIARSAVRVNEETLVIRGEIRQYVLERKLSGRWESNPHWQSFRAFKTIGLARLRMPRVISV
jgi:hypothetical protein